MMIKKINSYVVTVFLVSSCVLSCSTTQCKDHQNFKKTTSTLSLEKTVSGVDQMNKIKVFKADGTLQCNQGQKVDLQEMAKELIGIQIFSSENKHDGLMRIQLCGKPTGHNNIYEINSADLPKAMALGFKKWIRE